jgi:hypothetical protein
VYDGLPRSRLYWLWISRSKELTARYGEWDAGAMKGLKDIWKGMAPAERRSFEQQAKADQKRHDLSQAQLHDHDV